MYSANNTEFTFVTNVALMNVREFQNIIFVTTFEFLFAIVLSCDFHKVQISTNYEKIILKFILLLIALSRSSTIL